MPVYYFRLSKNPIHGQNPTLVFHWLWFSRRKTCKSGIVQTNFNCSKWCNKYRGKNPTSSQRAKCRNARKFIDISECTKTRNILDTLMLRYLRKIQCISDQFLADMPNDLPYILCCDWNFSPRATLGERARVTVLYVSFVQGNTKRLLALLLCDWVENNEGFLAPIRNLSYSDRLELLEFFSRPFRLFPTPTNCPYVCPSLLLVK